MKRLITVRRGPTARHGLPPDPALSNVTVVSHGGFIMARASAGVRLICEWPAGLVHHRLHVTGAQLRRRRPSRERVILSTRPRELQRFSEGSKK